MVVADSAKTIRIVLADDHDVMREGLAILLEDEEDLVIVGQAANGRDAVRLVRDLRPCVVLMDVSMPEMDGIEATAEISRDAPETRVIGLSMHDDPETTGRMRDAGAVAYFSKSGPPEELCDIIRSAAAS